MSPSIEPEERRQAALDALAGCQVRKPHKMQGRTVASVKDDSHDRKHVKGKAWRQCVKKDAYSTRRMVERVVERVFAQRGVKLRWYLCDRCGQYHVTKLFNHDEDNAQ